MSTARTNIYKETGSKTLNCTAAAAAGSSGLLQDIYTLVFHADNSADLTFCMFSGPSPVINLPAAPICGNIILGAPVALLGGQVALGYQTILPPPPTNVPPTTEPPTAAPPTTTVAPGPNPTTTVAPGPDPTTTAPTTAPSSGLSTGAVVGIAVGASALAAAGAFWFVHSRKVAQLQTQNNADSDYRPLA